jgi:tRNA U34 5-methylaminomethyl-2-thiouridine-forming methyltransferase MnmC
VNKLIIKNTADGSSTIYNSELDENYHSTHGALQEANHVFIQNGLKKAFEDFKSNKVIHLLEVGLGTALNCFLTFKYIQSSNVQINYCGIESFPLSIDIINQLNYKLSIQEKSEFEALHTTKWNKSVVISDNFILNKQHLIFQNYKNKQLFNLVYFDAFGPRVEHHLWDIKIFEKIFKMLTVNGILVTYCAKGQVRRDLIEVGFKVERLPGPPGKREMLRAIK